MNRAAQIRIGFFLALATAVLAGSPAGCSSPHATLPGATDKGNPERHEFARVLMGTRCRIVVYGSSEQAAAEACAAAFDRISELESVLSDYRADSEASVVMTRVPGVWHPVSADLAEALRRSLAVCEASDGAFDPAIGPLTKLWRASRRESVLPELEVLAEARSRSGMDLLEIDPERDRVRFSKPGMGLDFGGIGKGLAADAALAVLRERGIGAALIDFGGDLVAGDPPPGQPDGWRVVVEDGLGEPRRVWIANGAVATSGDLEQFVEIGGVRYAHILDPATGLGLTGPRAATVRADSGWLADALASAACVLGPDGAARLEAAFPGVSVWVSPSP